MKDYSNKKQNLVKVDHTAQVNTLLPYQLSYMYSTEDYCDFVVFARTHDTLFMFSAWESDRTWDARRVVDTGIDYLNAFGTEYQYMQCKLSSIDQNQTLKIVYQNFLDWYTNYMTNERDIPLHGFRVHVTTLTPNRILENNIAQTKCINEFIMLCNKGKLSSEVMLVSAKMTLTTSCAADDTETYTIECGTKNGQTQFACQRIGLYELEQILAERIPLHYSIIVRDEDEEVFMEVADGKVIHPKAVEFPDHQHLLDSLQWEDKQTAMHKDG